ncbi:hypothetical protein C7Y72_15840 [Paraconexibacter algicola]|uniref:Uncharacterized protein n=1 Tax=Paraconexibacter algicola TaxID=2133960 RepID=A0A2T4UFC8_9ACTN|nr:hypothetical protein C7Y72_15840 [Paraconexibacter algicola]
MQSPKARVGRKALWDRDTIIQAIQEWVALYGEPPRAADWNPSSARWSGQEWRVQRYRAGRADGTPWPALNAAKRPFGGSLVAAVRAAGFEPAKPGPKRRTDVDLAQADRAVISPEGRAMLEAALAEAREAGRSVAALEAKLERAQARARDLADQRDAARREARRTPKVVRERVVDDAELRRARTAAEKAGARVATLRDELASARMDAAEARTAAGRLASRLERAEATVADLRTQRRDLRAQLDDALHESAGLDQLLTEARAAGAAAAAETVVVQAQAPEAAVVREALADAAAARRAAEQADARAARADRELRETVAAVRGEPRRLAPEELAELRADGPAGPAVLATALQDLAAARRHGGEQRLAAALRRVAEAAVTWQERI